MPFYIESGKSEERCINDLFNTLQLGDSKPTQLLCKMKNRLGKYTMSDSLIRKLWIDKLPIHTAQILATLPEDLDMLKMAEIAHKINEAKALDRMHMPRTTRHPLRRLNKQAATKK